jgi:hypothetical protein
MVTKGPLPVATNSTDGWASTLQKRRPVSRDFQFNCIFGSSHCATLSAAVSEQRNGIRTFNSGTHLDAGGSGLDPNVRDALETLK